MVWTSGATESNNLALKGIAASAGQRRHIISSRLEHKAVLDTVNQLAGEGFDVTWLAVVRCHSFTLNNANAAHCGPSTNNSTQLQVAADGLNLRLNPGVLPVTRLNARLNAA